MLRNQIGGSMQVAPEKAASTLKIEGGVQLRLL
jgi:hypothetical protein